MTLLDKLRAIESIGNSTRFNMYVVGAEAHRTPHFVYLPLLGEEIDYWIRRFGFSLGAVRVLKAKNVSTNLNKA
jgi:hypothetical protein